MAISDFDLVGNGREHASRALQAVRKAFDIGENGRIQSLDGLRAIAVVLVFNTHFFGYYFNRSYFDQSSPLIAEIVHVLRNGDIGVDLFFVISGYLMFSILSKGRESSATYFFTRRALRLLPAQIVVLAFLCVGAPFLLKNFIANVFFVSPVLPAAHNLNPVTWSLTTELIFYVVIFYVFRTFTAFGLVQNRRAVIIATAATLLAMQFGFALIGKSGVLGHTLSEIALRTSGYMGIERTFGFLVGMCIASINRRSFSYLAVCIAVLSLVALIALRTIYGDRIISGGLGSAYFPAAASAFGVIVYCCLNPAPAASRALSLLPMQILGKISYSFYLIHYPLCESIHFFFPNIKTGRELLTAYVGMFAITVLLSALLYVHVERVYFNMGRRRSLPSTATT